MMSRSFSQLLFLVVFAAAVTCGSGKQKYTLEENVHHSYFNLDDDMTEELPKGTTIRMNNVNYKIIICMASGDHSFIQLDKVHNSEPGDFFVVVEDDTDLGLTAEVMEKAAGGGGIDLDDDGEDEEPVEKKPEEVKPRPGEFSEEIVFSENINVADVKAECKEKKKPGLVFVTQPWCGACKNLKTQVSKSESVKELLEKFVVVHAKEEEGDQWQAEGEQEGYIPRVYFLGEDGEMLDITGPNEDHSHFFGNSEALQKAMKKALALSEFPASHASDEL